MKVFYQKKPSIKAMLFAAWFVAFIVMIWGIANQEYYFAKSLPHVAEISVFAGDVVYRTENKVRWNVATKGVRLFDGDRISTSKDSSVTVTFVDGRELLLGEDSQVIISTSVHSEGGLTYTVNLVKGSAIANTKKQCRDCKDIILNSGGKTFNVGKGKKEGFFRDLVSNSVSKFNANEPVPTKSPVEDIPVKAIEEPVVEAPVKKTEDLVARGYEYSVRTPAEGATMWTHKNLASLFGEGILLPVLRPRKLPVAKKFVPIIEMTNLEGTKKEVLVGISSSDNVILLPFSKLRILATQRWSGAKQYLVNLRGGIRVYDGRKSVESFSGEKVSIAVNSIGEILGTPIALAFDRLSAQTPTGNWIPAKTIIPVSSGNIQVTLFGAADFFKMIPFAVGANRYGVLTTNQSTAAVANIVRDGLIVAQITKYSTIEDVKTVVRALGGSFAFIGARNLYQYTAGNSRDNVVKLVDELLDKRNVLFFYKNDKLYPVNRGFIKDSKEVANFLGEQATVFFTEKVEIINR